MHVSRTSHQNIKSHREPKTKYLPHTPEKTTNQIKQNQKKTYRNKPTHFNTASSNTAKIFTITIELYVWCENLFNFNKIASVQNERTVCLGLVCECNLNNSTPPIRIYCVFFVLIFLLSLHSDPRNNYTLPNSLIRKRKPKHIIIFDIQTNYTYQQYIAMNAWIHQPPIETHTHIRYSSE